MILNRNVWELSSDKSNTASNATEDTQLLLDKNTKQEQQKQEERPLKPDLTSMYCCGVAEIAIVCSLCHKGDSTAKTGNIVLCFNWLQCTKTVHFRCGKHNSFFLADCGFANVPVVIAAQGPQQQNHGLQQWHNVSN